MNKQLLTVRRMAIMAAFFISCFGLFLVLWLRAGGATPLAPAKYRVHLLMPQAKGLGPHSDVRVSGVTVGHVVEITAARQDGRAIPRADILVDLERPFAPLRADANAMLRSKSILGEAYVAISLGSPGAPLVPEGGTLARSQGRDSVSPDQIFETYDRPTRAALRAWLQTEGPAARRHGEDLNAAVGSLRPWVADAGDLLEIVDRQGSDVARLLRDGGTIANGLADRGAALRALYTSGERAFAATGDEARNLAATFRSLGPFEREATRTLRAVGTFARARTADVEVLSGELAPLSPALAALGARAVPLRDTAQALPGTERAGRTGFPATDDLLDATPSVLAELDPWLRRLNPALRYLSGRRTELTTLIANLAAALQIATSTPNGATPLHYLRAMPVLSPQVLAPLTKRPGINRANAYPDPAQLDPNANPSYDTRSCGNPTPYFRDEPSPYLTDDQRKQIHDFVYLGDPAHLPAPPCKAQSSNGLSAYPELPVDPEP